MSKETATVRRLVFGGMRIVRGERRVEWVSPDDDVSLYYSFHPGKTAGYSVGCEYDVKLDEDNTMYGSPAFVGKSEDADLRAKLSTLDTGARQRWDLDARERKASKNNELNNRIDEVAELIKHLPAPQRAGVINYIAHRLSRVW